MTNQSDGNTTDNTDVIDWSVLDALRVLQRPGRPDICKTLMKAYLDSIPALMESTKAAVRAADGTALRNTAHSMKSSSLAIGAVLFGKTCADLELLGKSNTLEEAQSLLYRAEQEFIATCAALHNALANENMS
jgi:HPt (histidine-containing phosphotransfer) domain-containing protein